MLAAVGIPSRSAVKESACNEGDCLKRRSCSLDLWIGKIPRRRKWQLTLVFLPGKFHGQRSLAGYSPWGHKESDTTENAHMQGNCATLSDTCSDCIAIVIPELFAFPNAPQSLSSFLVSLTLHMTVMYNNVRSLRF